MSNLAHINRKEERLLKSKGRLRKKDDPALASLGRKGDQAVAYLTPEDEKLLASVGGSGTINPHTGLKEFWGIGSITRALGNPVGTIESLGNQATGGGGGGGGFLGQLGKAISNPLGTVESLGQQAINTVQGVTSNPGKVVTDITGGALNTVNDIANKIGSTVDAIANDPKKLAAVALLVAFPEAAATVGNAILPEAVSTSLGATGTAIVGQAAINTATNGGDVNAAVKAALVQQGLPAVSQSINTSQFGQNLSAVITKYGTQATTAAGLAAIMGKDPVAALLLSGAQQATNALLTQNPDVKAAMDTLPKPAQSAISSALVATLSKQNVNQAVADSIINSAIGQARNYVQVQKSQTASGKQALTDSQLQTITPYINAAGASQVADVIGKDTTEKPNWTSLSPKGQEAFTQLVNSGLDDTNAFNMAQSFFPVNANPVIDPGTVLAGPGDSRLGAITDQVIWKSGGDPANIPAGSYARIMGHVDQYLQQGGNVDDEQAFNDFMAKFAPESMPSVSQTVDNFDGTFSQKFSDGTVRNVGITGVTENPDGSYTRTLDDGKTQTVDVLGNVLSGSSVGENAVKVTDTSQPVVGAGTVPDMGTIEVTAQREPPSASFEPTVAGPTPSSQKSLTPGSSTLVGTALNLPGPSTSVGTSVGASTTPAITSKAVPGMLEQGNLFTGTAQENPNLMQNLQQLYPSLTGVNPNMLAQLQRPNAAGTSQLLTTGVESLAPPTTSTATSTSHPLSSLLSMLAPGSSGGNFSALSSAGLQLLGGGQGALPAFKTGGEVKKAPVFITGKTGHYVKGHGDGQSDDIPAMLADGEYVFDADTVAALGNGSSDAGAAILDRMRENIRKHKRSAPIEKIPPKAKSPLEYLKG